MASIASLELAAQARLFETHQAGVIVAEHVAFRRKTTDLGAVLRAYGEFHERGAAHTNWQLSDLHTVIVAAHNHAGYLPDSLASVFRQDWRPLELLVVDDGSTDDTRDVLSRIAESCPSDVVMRTLHTARRRGQTGAINLGTLAARGSVCTMVDADDYMLAGTITLARRALAEHRASLFGGTAVRFWEALPEELAIAIPLRDVPLDRYDPAHLFDSPTTLNISHTGSTYLRAAWRAVGGYRRHRRTRVTFACDREFHLRIASLFPIVTTPIPVSHWRMGSSVQRGADH